VGHRKGPPSRGAANRAAGSRHANRGPPVVQTVPHTPPPFHEGRAVGSRGGYPGFNVQLASPLLQLRDSAGLGPASPIAPLTSGLRGTSAIRISNIYSIDDEGSLSQVVHLLAPSHVDPLPSAPRLTTLAHQEDRSPRRCLLVLDTHGLGSADWLLRGGMV